MRKGGERVERGERKGEEVMEGKMPGRMGKGMSGEDRGNDRKEGKGRERRLWEEICQEGWGRE